MARSKATGYSAGLYSGMLEARFPATVKARTFSMVFGRAGRSISEGIRHSFQGLDADSANALNVILDQELTKLAHAIKPIFKEYAPEDPTDSEAWNANWWHQPTLRESIMKSPIIKRGLRKGVIEFALRMRWYGFLTIEGRGPQPVAPEGRPYRFKLKDGTWVSTYGADWATRHPDLLTGEAPAERMGWAGYAYNDARGFIEASRDHIAQRVMNEALALRLQQDTKNILVEQVRAERRRAFDFFAENVGG